MLQTSSTNIYEASRQWYSRPDDQRFLSMEDLAVFVRGRRERCFDTPVAMEHLMPRVNTQSDDNRLGFSWDKGSGESVAEPTHWAFGQICQRAGAPSAYLRKLPAMVAQIPLAWSLEMKRGEDSKLLLERGLNGAGETMTLRAATSDTYGRIWDHEVVDAMMKNLDLSLWKIPSASYASSNPKRATTLYASDRDVFVFLVNESHPIEIPGTNGRDTLFRGFYAKNSEVGSSSLEFCDFLYRYVCDNRIIWGAQNVRKLRIRHTSGGPHRFVREARPAIQALLEQSTQETVEMVQRASAKEVGKTHKDVKDWLKNRGFTAQLAGAALERAEQEEGNPRTVWNLVQGLTSIAGDKNHTDTRVALEAKAGKLLQAVTA